MKRLKIQNDKTWNLEQEVMPAYGKELISKRIRKGTF